MHKPIAAACFVAMTFLCGRALSAPEKPPAKPPATTVAQLLDREWTRLEGELVPAAEAMPESQFDFSPTLGEFKGVRTFAQQVKHVAYTNFKFFAALLGEKSEYPKEANGPAALKSKAAPGRRRHHRVAQLRSLRADGRVPANERNHPARQPEPASVTRLFLRPHYKRRGGPPVVASDVGVAMSELFPVDRAHPASAASSRCNHVRCAASAAS